jgi:hypothetical protein
MHRIERKRSLTSSSCLRAFALKELSASMAVMATIAVANCKATFIVIIYLLPLISRSKIADAAVIRCLED